MPRPKAQNVPTYLDEDERKRELARLRMQKMRARKPANPDSVRLALVEAAAEFPEDVRRRLVEVMVAAVAEEKRSGYRTVACKLLNLPAPTEG